MYEQTHLAVNQVFRTAHRFSFQLHVFNSNAGKQYVRLVQRWTRTSLLLFFHELRHGQPNGEALWETLSSSGLVRSEERLFLQGLSSSQRSMLMLQWIARMTYIGWETCERGMHPPPTILRCMVDQILDMDEAQ